MIELDINDDTLPNIESDKVFCFRLTDEDVCNDTLKKFILDYKDHNKGMKASNIGGWHSAYAFYKEKNVELEKLMTIILNCTTKICDRPNYHDIAKFTHLWANVSMKGNYNRRHKHSGKQKHILSACYYVFMDDHKSGEFVMDEIDVTVQPVAGMLLIFPSSLYHEVLPYNGDTRISIACNTTGDYHAI